MQVSGHSSHVPKESVGPLSFLLSICFSALLAIFRIAVTKHLMRSHLKERCFSLVHTVQRHTDHHGGEATAASTQEVDWAKKYKTQPSPEDPFPSASVYLLKILQPSKVVPPSEKEV